MKNNDDKPKSAPILFQMFIYALVLFVSQIISNLMTHIFVLPTPVVGLVLLYVLLSTHIVKLEWVDSFGSALISIIGFLFVPSGISLAKDLDIMKTEGVQLVLVILLSTIVLLVVTAYTARILSFIINKIKPTSTTNDKDGNNDAILD